MELEEAIHILAGSTIGLILRLTLKYNFIKEKNFYINHYLIVNILAALFLGALVALNPINKNFKFLFYVGFLGCFSTFSSFIYQLFILIQNKKFLKLLFYYLEVLILSFLCFFAGYFIVLTFKN